MELFTYINVNILHSTTFLYRVNNTLRSLITKLVIPWGGLWGARYPRRNGFFWIKLCMYLDLGKLFNICENKKKFSHSFFGKVKKPKFKHKRGGGGEPGPEIEIRSTMSLSSIIFLSTIKISAKSFCRNIENPARVTNPAVLVHNTEKIFARQKYTYGRFATCEDWNGPLGGFGPFPVPRLPSRHTHTH